MLSDPVSEMLARIRNANMRRKEDFTVHHSNLKEGILQVLQREGFIRQYEVQGQDPKKSIKVFLKYSQKGVPVIRKIKKISKPGNRVRKGYADLKPVLNSQGVTVISTSQGILSDFECRTKKIGGEVLLEIY